MTRLLFDLESNGFLDELNTIHSLVLKDPDTKEVFSCHDFVGAQYPLKDALQMLKEADEVIGHNIIKFDIPALHKVFPQFSIDEDKVTDTLVISRLIWTNLRDLDFEFQRKNPEFLGNLIGRHSLEAWGHRLRMHKGDYAKEMAAKGLDPWATWNSDMQDYCELDVEVTEALLTEIEKKKYSPIALKLEHQFQYEIHRQETFGFPFNVKEAEALYLKMAKRRAVRQQGLAGLFPPWLVRGDRTIPKKTMNRFVENPFGKFDEKRDKTGYIETITEGLAYNKIKLTMFNAGSRDHIANRLKTLRGWKPTVFGKDGKPTVDADILATLKYPEAIQISDYLMLQKRIGQLAEGQKSCLKYVQPDGRIYGKVNTNGAVTGRCTHHSPNISQTPSSGVEFGTEFRALYHAPTGWKLIGVDASGLELRCLSHYLALFDGGDYVDTILNGDIHTHNMQAAGLNSRVQAKTFIYAFIFGAGDRKLGQIIGKGGKAGRLLKLRFLDQLPALKTLRESLQKKVKRLGYVKGIDGRLIHIRSEHSALNFLLQGAGAVLVKQATIIFHQDMRLKYQIGSDYQMVAHIHDEFQILTKQEIAEDVGEIATHAFRKAGEFFNFRCPIEGEFKVGNNWSETH